MIRGEEMHKSLGNFVTLEQGFERWEPMVIRFFVLLSHYRGPMDFTEEAIDAAGKGLDRLLTTIRSVRRRLADGAPEGKPSKETFALLDEGRSRFEDNMNDDFNTAGAIAALFDLNREINARLGGPQPLSQGDLQAIDRLYETLVGDVLGALPDSLDQELGVGLSTDLIALLVDTRATLREHKQWALADGIRDQLNTLGIQLEDRPEGTGWTLGTRAR